MDGAASFPAGGKYCRSISGTMGGHGRDPRPDAAILSRQAIAEASGCRADRSTEMLLALQQERNRCARLNRTTSAVKRAPPPIPAARGAGR